MPIPERQLVIWSNQGAEATSATTYNSIKSTIEGINWNKDVSYEIYLQGSYRNKTNIYGDSDVDVVFEVNSSFYHNINDLDSGAQSQFEKDHPGSGAYTLDSFKKLIASTFVDTYGKSYVEEGGKAVTVLKNNGRLNCDVVCCFTYRRYISYSILSKNNYHSGIQFYDSKNNRWIVNFPKQHYDNGVNKNQAQRTNGNFKPLVRIFKNIKSKLVDDGRITSDLAPSYFIQCLLYNVPDNLFWGGTYQQILAQILNRLLADLTNDSMINYISQNGIIPLFGISHEQWDLTSVKHFINQVITLNNEG